MERRRSDSSTSPHPQRPSCFLGSPRASQSPCQCSRTRTGATKQNNPTLPPHGNLAMSGGCASDRQRPGLLLNTLQCTGKPLVLRMSAVPSGADPGTWSCRPLGETQNPRAPYPLARSSKGKDLFGPLLLADLVPWPQKPGRESFVSSLTFMGSEWPPSTPPFSCPRLLWSGL